MCDLQNLLQKLTRYPKLYMKTIQDNLNDRTSMLKQNGSWEFPRDLPDQSDDCRFIRNWGGGEGGGGGGVY